MREMTFVHQERTDPNLPDGWETSRLVEISDIVMGQSPPSSTYNQDGVGLPFFQGKAEFGALLPTPKVYCSKPKKYAQEGAVLLSVRAPVGPVNLAPSLCAIGRGLAAIHPLGDIPSKFVLHFFRSYANTLAKQATGTTFKAISKKTVENIPIVVPPLNEQRRIVAKIEALFSELEAGVAALEEARAQVKRYRQALLKAAFEGRLTEDWRTEHADELKPAEALLARIRAERETRWQAQLAAWQEAVAAWESAGKPGKKPRKPRPLKELPPLTEEELAALPELPEGWVWTSFGDIVLESVLGKMLDKKKNKGTPRPYLRNTNVRWGGFDLSDIQEMRIEDDELERYRLRYGDLVICEGGEPGRCAVWKEEVSDMSFQKALHRVRLPNNLVSPQYAHYHFYFFARVGRLRKWFTGTTIKHLTGVGLSRVSFPLCSIEEQQEITSELDRHLSNIDNLDQTIAQALAQAAALRQAILKKAFSARLVLQDPEDEPAGVLLERIRGPHE